jgi:succinate dehydrogenase/fumarate reductase flavoprotein subunit
MRLDPGTPQLLHDEPPPGAGLDRERRRTLADGHAQPAAPVLGGATSWSGGWMWAPLNPLSQADGIIEDVDAPRTYLKHALGENYDEPRVEALLENARHMVGFFEKHTALQFVSGTWIADIQGDLPGAGS